MICINLSGICPINWAQITKYNCSDLGPVDGTNPTQVDTDGDGMHDGWEAKLGYATKTDDLDIIEKFDTRYGFVRMGYNYSDLLKTDPNVTGVWLVNPLDHQDKFDDIDEDGFDVDGNGINKSEEFSNFEEFRFNLWKKS